MIDIFEVFPGSISQEENWTDSVRNYDNEHPVAWAISMLSVLSNQLAHSSSLMSSAQSNR